MQVGIIILAAGNSSRLGQSKQLVQINGVSLLRRSTEIAVQTTLPVVVVLGADAEVHQQVIADLKTEIVVNDVWQTGMGSSLKAGLSHLIQTNPKVEAAMILVCDQPYLSFAHLQKLIAANQQQVKPIVASTYANVIGVPAIFKKELFPHLLQLDNDSGARKIIQQFTDQAHVISFEKGEIDIDTPQDLLHLPKA
ncbi:MAG TPA: 4-diphosphocytidyl-2C-methyl-D-erythritol synthase [Cytophagales bacterium]|nr:4-diphosphocytidyl-2C-methyl-D-erythritol synthase [Cytophagales bacterium]